MRTEQEYKYRGGFALGQVLPFMLYLVFPAKSRDVGSLEAGAVQNTAEHLVTRRV